MSEKETRQISYRWIDRLGRVEVLSYLLHHKSIDSVLVLSHNIVIDLLWHA